MATIVIPLGNGSRSGNDELRISLRSLASNGENIRRIIIVSDCAPSWLRNVEVVPMADELKHNKDGNIIRKFVAGIQVADVHGTVVFSSDDHVLMKPMDFEILPSVYNTHGREYFASDTGTWKQRMTRTFDFLKGRGVNLTCHYDSHCFQPYDADSVVGCLQGVDYDKEGGGYCINTLLKGLLGAPNPINQAKIKSTHETVGSAKEPMDKSYLGYNDNAFSNGLRQRLFEKFPSKCRYEA